MNFKHMMVVVAMSTLVGQGALAIPSFEAGDRQAVDVYRALDIDKLGVKAIADELSANPDASYQVQLKNEVDLGKMVQAINLVQANSTLRGAIALKLVSAGALPDLSGHLRQAYKAGPQIAFTIEAARELNFADKATVLDAVGVSVAASGLSDPKGVVFDGEVMPSVVDGWAKRNASVINKVTFGPKFVAYVGEKGSERLLRSDNIRIQVPGADRIVANYDPTTTGFVVRDLKNNHMVKMKNFSFKGAKDAMAIDQAQ